MISVTLYKDTAVLYTVYRGREYERVISGHGEVNLLLEALKHINVHVSWKYMLIQGYTVF